MTKENGIFETLSVIFLLSISIIGILTLIKKTIHIKYIKILIGLFSILTFFAAMEEISWGQHLFHFQSSSFFELHNYQKETNLHNLIDGNIFSSIIYSCVYSVFIFIPLLTILFENKHKLLKTFSRYVPSFHIVLIILYGSSFQIYFYDDIGVITDMATLIAGIVLFIITLTIKKLWDKYLLIHLLFVVSAMFMYMYTYQIFSFFNMQYEIREMFVIFATLLYFKEFIKKIETI
jgi:hypothetical protein